MPESVPISSAKAKSLQRLAAEQEQREHRQHRAEAGGQRAHDDLAHRPVDDLGERGARHARHVLADPVEHDDRVVEREAQDGEQRRDRRRRHLPADEGVDARRDQDVVHQRDQHRHGELPLEAQRDVDRDDDQRGDDRDTAPSWRPTGRTSARSPTPRARRATPNVSSSAVGDLRRAAGDSRRRSARRSAPSSSLLDRLDLRVAEARRARPRRAPASTVAGSLERRRDPRARLEVDAEVQAVGGDRQRADEQDHARTSRRTSATRP